MTYITSSFREDLLGMPTIGKPVTATLYVSPNGDNSDGSSWAKAYTTLTAALDAASTDSDAHTAIMVGINPAGYDINTTGDPTWSCNVDIIGPHRMWSPIKNTHASATSILKLTGYASLNDLAFSQQGTVNGVIITKSGARVRRCGFNSSACTSAVKSLFLDGSSGVINGSIVEDCEFVSNTTYTTAIHLINSTVLKLRRININNALEGLLIAGASSSKNYFDDMSFSNCATAIDVSAGSYANFDNIHFIDNVVRIVETSTTGNSWNNIKGEFGISIYPENLTGVQITAGDGTWGTDTELRSSATATKPFKVIGFTLAPSNEESTLIRFSADSGTTFFTERIFSTKKDKASGNGDSTDFIFSKGARISASVWSPGSGRTVDVWLDIQEI